MKILRFTVALVLSVVYATCSPSARVGAHPDQFRLQFGNDPPALRAERANLEKWFRDHRLSVRGARSPLEYSESVACLLFGIFGGAFIIVGVLLYLFVQHVIDTP